MCWLAERPAEARAGEGLAAVSSCSVVGSSVFQGGPVGVHVGAGSWVLLVQTRITKPFSQPEDPEGTPGRGPALSDHHVTMGLITVSARE